MQLQYGQVVQYLPDFLRGALLSLEIAFLAFVMGLGIGLAGASLLQFGPRAARMAVRAYVGCFTNTPQLVQVFFLFYALPEAGILLSPFQAVLLGMTLNAGAYLTEIQRAGFQSIQRAELDAAETLGLRRPVTRPATTMAFRALPGSSSSFTPQSRAMNPSAIVSASLSLRSCKHTFTSMRPSRFTQRRAAS